MNEPSATMTTATSTPLLRETPLRFTPSFVRNFSTLLPPRTLKPPDSSRKVFDTPPVSRNAQPLRIYCVARVMMNGNTFSQAYTAPLRAESATASAMPMRMVGRKPRPEPFSIAMVMPTVATRKPVERSMPPPSMMKVMPTPMMSRFAF